MSARSSVLIIDPLEESREVLRTVLERLGVQILAASQPRQGLALAREHRPDVIVLDLECEPPDLASESGCAAEFLAGDTPLVLLGSARRHATQRSGVEFVSKPYHYAPLIRRIEELLADARQAASSQ